MDRLSKAARSALMSKIRGNDLKPEASLRAALRKLKVKFRRNMKSLPGKPDLYFPLISLAVFIHGCFFHGCMNHFRLPRTNRRFWRGKIAANRRRDCRVARKLHRLGVSVKTVWEHSIRRDPRITALRIVAAVSHAKSTRSSLSY